MSEAAIEQIRVLVACEESQVACEESQVVCKEFVKARVQE